MARLYNHLTSDLAYCAVSKCLEHKWRRNDVQTYIEEWTGYSRKELYADEIAHKGLSVGMKYNIICELACAAEDMVDGIIHGIDPDLDPVSVREKPDGATGKIRRIAYLCMRHQVLGHLVKLGIEPLLNARLLPTQHASIPGKGQTGLARQVKRMLNRKLGIKMYVKTDCTSAYASVMYSLCIDLIKKEIPRAKWILACLRVLERYAPDGHLIIGGYLDAWLFNFVMSYALRYVLSLSKSRRDNKYPLVIRAGTFMDDMVLMGRSETALRQAVKSLTDWLQRKFHMTMRTTTAIIRLYTVEEEKEHKRRTRPAARGCPSIDMGGFRIHRSHITIRRRNVKRILRCFTRAWTELQATGTIKRQRAMQIISRNGMVSNTDAYRLCHKYHVHEIIKVAKRVQAYWLRVADRNRKERLNNAVDQHRIHREALCCSAGAAG